MNPTHIKLTKTAVEALTAGNQDRFVWDDKLTGFGVKVTPRRRKVFIFVYRYPRGRAGKVRRFTIGSFGDISVEHARVIATEKAGLVASGIDPMAKLEADRKAARAEKAAPKQSVLAIAAAFVERHHKAQNKTWREAERIINRHIIPAFGSRRIGDVGRGEINSLLDDVEDKSGKASAQAVLKQIRRMFNWHAVRDERFVSPLVRGMARISPKEQRRKRTLTDDEMGVVWLALEKSRPPFRQIVRALLFTAQRRNEIGGARRSEIDETGAQITIPPERHKSGLPHVVPLTGAARAQIEDLGDFGKLGDCIFTTTGTKPFNGFSRAKAELDAEIERILRERLPVGERRRKGPLMPHWTLHDLRRTAKTIMQRIKVRPDISERVLGHTMKGVEGTYDQYSYLDEKRDALERLAAEVLRIVKPQVVDAQ